MDLTKEQYLEQEETHTMRYEKRYEAMTLSELCYAENPTKAREEIKRREMAFFARNEKSSTGIDAYVLDPQSGRLSCKAAATELPICYLDGCGATGYHRDFRNRPVCGDCAAKTEVDMVCPHHDPNSEGCSFCNPKAFPQLTPSEDIHTMHHGNAKALESNEIYLVGKDGEEHQASMIFFECPKCNGALGLDASAIEDAKDGAPYYCMYCNTALYTEGIPVQDDIPF